MPLGGRGCPLISDLQMEGRQAAVHHGCLLWVRVGEWLLCPYPGLEQTHCTGLETRLCEGLGRGDKAS